MPYTHFRFIAYQVPTAAYPTAGTGGPYTGYPAGGTCPAVADIPVAGDAAAPPDWHIRLRRLAAVVDRAAANLGAGDNAATLKVFVAPEFYFRPPAGADVAFRRSTYAQEHLFAIWGALDRMFQSPRFADWLIVPGTVMWNRPREEDAARSNYFNSVLYVRGGPREQATRMIEKQLPSTIDGIPVPFAPGYDPSLRPIYEDWRTQTDRIFRVDNVGVGVEVCLDHADDPQCRVLKTVLSRWTQRFGELSSTHQARVAGDANVPVPALHVLTAGGMPTVPRSVAARIGGFLLRNDGLPNGAAPVELRRVQNYIMPNAQFPQGVQASVTNLSGSAQLAPDAFLTTVVPLPPGPETVSDLPGPRTYHTFAQQLMIYPARPLP
jgi:hypothetical protein